MTRHSRPHPLVFLLAAHTELHIIRKGPVRQLEHALRDGVYCLGLAGGRKDSKNVGRGDASVGDVRGYKDAFAKGRIGMHVDVFVMFSVVPHSCDGQD